MKLRLHIDAQWQDAASGCAWALLDDADQVRDTGSATLAALPQHDAAEIIVASDRVLASVALLPALRRSKLESALPYALEEGLIDDAATAHVTPGPRLADGRSVLYAVDRPWLLRLLAACTAARIRVRRVVPEFCLLPVRGDEWSVAWDGMQGFLSTAQGLGGALDSADAEHAPAALRLRLQQGAPAALRLYISGNTLPQWNLGVPLICEQQNFDWRKAIIPAQAPNLMWGKLAPAPRISELWPWLRPAALAALLLLGIEIVASNAEWALLAHEQHRLQQGMNETFRETFGADATIVDAPLQMQRNIARLRHAAGRSDDADFIPLLDSFALAADKLPGFSLRSVRYADGKLDCELTLPTAATLDMLLQRIAAGGLQAQVVDRHEINGTLTAQLRLSAGGAR